MATGKADMHASDPWCSSGGDPWKSFRRRPLRKDGKHTEEEASNLRKDGTHKLEKMMHGPLFAVKHASGAVCHFFDKQLAKNAADKVMDAVCGGIALFGSALPKCEVPAVAGSGWRSKLVATKSPKSRVGTGRLTDNMVLALQLPNQMRLLLVNGFTDGNTIAVGIWNKLKLLTSNAHLPCPVRE